MVESADNIDIQIIEFLEKQIVEMHKKMNLELPEFGPIPNDNVGIVRRKEKLHDELAKLKKDFDEKERLKENMNKNKNENKNNFDESLKQIVAMYTDEFNKHNRRLRTGEVRKRMSDLCDEFVDFMVGDLGCVADEYDELFVCEPGGAIYEQVKAKSLADALGKVIAGRYGRQLRNEIPIKNLVVRFRERCVALEKFNATSLFAMRNCMVDIRKGDDGHYHVHTEDLNRDYYCTFVAGVDYVKDAKCPKWMAYLDYTFRHLSDKERPVAKSLMGQMFGLCMFPHPGNHHGWWLIGPPRVGKSSSVKTLEKIMGSLMSAVPLSKYAGYKANRFATSGMIGKRCNIDDDVNRGIKTSWEDYRKIASKALANYERKGKDAVDMRLNITLVYATNAMPKGHFDSALVGRIQPIIFKKKPEKEIPEIEKTFEDELPGIVNWALDEVCKTYDNGGHIVNGTPTEIAKMLIDTWAGNVIDLAVAALFEEDSDGELTFDIIRKNVIGYLMQNEGWDIKHAYKRVNPRSLGIVELVQSSRKLELGGKLYALRFKHGEPGDTVTCQCGANAPNECNC